jgi:hypothetical protein
MVGLAAGVTLTASACGVQPTGVHVASTIPFTASSAQNPPSATSAGSYVPVNLFLVSKSGGGNPHEVTRYLPKKPSRAEDLLEPLAQISNDDEASNLTTSVPEGLQLRHTDNAHEYVILGPSPSAIALKQMACTFDRYWRQLQPPDGQEFSTQFLLSDGSPWGWDDCHGVFGDSEPGPAPGKPTKLPPATIVTPRPYGR